MLIIVCGFLEIFFLFSGDNIFTFWDILVNLLQEDDDEVKTIASRVVHKLNPEVQGQLKYILPSP